jgi:hypothetical protein
MTVAKEAVFSCTLTANDLHRIEVLLFRSVNLWSRNRNLEKLAAKWDQLAQSLCRKGVPIDDFLNAVERVRPEGFSEIEYGTFQDFVRNQVIRGYQETR